VPVNDKSQIGKEKMKNIFLLMRNVNENAKMIALKNRFAVPIGNFLSSINLKPAFINVVGLVVGLIAAIFVGQGRFGIGFVLFAVAGASDALDGTVARLKGEVTLTGAFIDSVFDRYVDLSIMLGLAYYFHVQGDTLTLFGVFLGILGAMITSYTNARGASLGIRRYVGFFGRPQRVIVLLIGLLFPDLLEIVVWVSAVFANYTAIDRTVFYIKELIELDKNQGNSTK
jgi:phosphatidylglycerophosphate synthase